MKSTINDLDTNICLLSLDIPLSLDQELKTIEVVLYNLYIRLTSISRSRP